MPSARLLEQSQFAARRGARSRASCSRTRAATLKQALGWRHDVIFTLGRERGGRDGRGARQGRRAARTASTEHAIVPFAMGEGSTVIPVDANGLIDEAALDARAGRGAGAGRDPARSTTRPGSSSRSIGSPPKIRAAGSLLLADCAQSASKLPLPDADFIAICGAQARRAARDRRAAGQGPGDARAVRRRAGAGLSPRHAGRARRGVASPRRCRRGPMTWRGWRRCARGSRTGVEARGRPDHRRGGAARRRRSARSRCPARPAWRCSSSSTSPGSRSRPEAPVRRARPRPAMCSRR